MEGFKRTAIGAVVVLGVAFAPAASARATGPSALIAGTVANNGVPVAGATVATEVWPNQATMRVARKGQQIKTRTLSIVHTDTAGHFRISNSLASLPAMYRDPTGQVNIALDVTRRSRHARWMTSLKPTSAGAYASMATSAAEQTDRVLLELGTDKAKLKLAANHSADSIKGNVPLDNHGCFPWTGDGGRGPFKAIWGDIQATGPAIGGYEYQTSAMHRLGVVAGIDSNGFGASGSANLTTSVSKTLASGAYLHDQRIWAQIEYYQSERACPGYTQYQMIPWYLVYPVNAYTIGHMYQHVICHAEAKGFHTTMGDAKNYDYTWGLNIYGGAFESQAGWSSEIQFGLQFNAAGTMCWNNMNFGAATLFEGH